ncbi:MAG: hypothetical protein HY900_38435 [Deltaproteobacteria bacterium]|nr:hypothetical protein [Deltaproteobacteria bacterium]
MDLEAFLDGYLYAREAFLIDELVRTDAERFEIEARMETRRALPIASLQRGDPELHPRHVSGPEMILATANLGCLHAWAFHGVRWSDGWVGFGTRIHRADFKNLALIGPPLELHSKETRSRLEPQRIVLRYEFRFTQEGRPVYFSDQTAIFLKGREFAPE